jgi:hypothetical protein
MKLLKALIVAISIATLPFALVAVGPAQQLNCWGLRPTSRIEVVKHTEEYNLDSFSGSNDSDGNANDNGRHDQTRDEE